MGDLSEGSHACPTRIACPFPSAPICVHPRFEFPGQKSPLYFSLGQPQIPRMRRAISMATILIVAPFSLTRARGETALDALKELPRDQAARIARIEGRDGSPDPDRWYILTQDPTADNGLHEFVVSNGQVVASRALSQFADSLKPEDILGTPVTIDSDKAAKLARAYAGANGSVVASLNYELKKDSPEAEPAWTISCLDEKGNKVGEVVLTAQKGSVVSHLGFALDPEPEATAEATPTATPEPTPKKKPHFDTYAKPEVAVAAVGSPPEEDAGGGSPGHPQKKPVSPILRTFDNVGRTLHKFLPF